MKDELKVFENFSKNYKAAFYNGRYYLIKKNAIINTNDFPRCNGSDNRVKMKISDFTLLVLILTVVVICSILNNSYIFSIVIAVSIHELAHIFIARIIGVNELYVGFKVNYWVFPMVYISASNIYEKYKYQRIMYYSAGIMVNSLFALTGFFISGSLNFFIQINLMLAIVNSIPFLFTDGYNILREITEIYNLREVVVTNFFKPSKLLKKQKIILIYYGFILFSTGYIISQIIQFIIKCGFVRW